VLGGLAATGAAEAWVRAAALARQLDDSGELLTSLLGLSACLVVRADLEPVLGIGEELLALGKAQVDDRCVIAGHFARGTAAWCLGRLRFARQELDEARTLGGLLDDASLVATFGWNDPAVLGTTMLTLADWLVDDRGPPVCPGRSAHDHAGRRRHPLTEAIALIIEASHHAMRRDVPAVRRRAVRLDALNSDHGLRDCEAAARIFRGWAVAVAGGGGGGDDGVAELVDGLATHTAAGFRVLGPFYRSLLSDAYHHLGRLDEALATIEEALLEVEITGQRLYEAELHRMRGELMLSLGRQEGESSLRLAVTVARDQGAVPFQARAEASLARLVTAAVD